MKRVGETDLFHIVDPRPRPQTFIGRILRAVHDYLYVKNETCWVCDAPAMPDRHECWEHLNARPM